MRAHIQRPRDRLSTTVSGPDTPSGIPVQKKADDLPKSSEEALEFLESIDVRDFRHLLFEDNLVTISDTGKELGEFKVTISSTQHEGVSCYLIHANSHGAIDSVLCGTSITAYVSAKLETLEQQHHEYVQDVQRTVQTFSVDSMAGFISEGSNLLLQRLLVRKGIPENLQLLSFDSDSNLCSVTYRSLDARIQTILEKDLEVLGVERTINSSADLPTTWQSYYTKEGHLSSRVQIGSPVTMRLTALPPPVEEDEEEDKPTFGKKELNWEEDMQLYSKFLERKDELRGDHAAYMRRHPELKAILADFLQFLLLRKPGDVVAFAAEYFSSFSSTMPSTSPYAESAKSTHFPQNCSNAKIGYLTKATSEMI
ncbi:hypothetical protein CAPTEDRAFT_229000 [Capitella teleta]|uniref:Ciliogenesis-associated TTC17-interacting protein n=1 Tax=Capitella teleta TaxID=283909 RepID=R7UNX7_CAPTE|nr:hypothetical protein CAPTEDRAFT_229000 [Capitella teleta]|eukprot:ELU05627.1 hypothetical protein CAPTEDRAFT_229000 [Capitella teleta]